VGVVRARLSATAGVPRVWAPMPYHVAGRVRSVAVSQDTPVWHVEQGYSPEKDEAAGIRRTPCVQARGVL
jgi:hypothetical protein